MATQKEKSAAAAALSKKLAESKARAAAAQQAKDGGNGQTAPAAPAEAAAPAPDKKPAPVKKRKVDVKSAPAKKAPKAKTKAPKEPTKKVTPAKKQGKKSAPAKKAEPKAPKAPKAPAKKAERKDPPVIQGLASIAGTKEIDEKTGLTKFQVSLVRLIEKAGPEGLAISELTLRVWTRDQIKQARETETTSAGTPLDLVRIIRNSIRRPVDQKFIERVDGSGLYRFLEWKTVGPRKPKAPKKAAQPETPAE